MAQEHFFKEIDYLRKYQLDSIVYNKDYNNFTNRMILWQKEFLVNFNIYSQKLKYIDSIKLRNKEFLLGKFLYYINKGDYLYFKYQDKNLEANTLYVRAFNLALSNNNKQLLCEALKKILDLNRYSYLDGNSTFKHYVAYYEKNSYDYLEHISRKFYTQSLSFQFGLYGEWDSKIEEALLNFSNNSSHYFLNSRIYQLIGTYYHDKKDNKTAIEFELKALKELDKIKFNYKKTLKKINIISLIRYNLFNDNHKLAQDYLNNIDKSEHNKLEKQFKKYYFFYQAYLDSINNQYKSAYLNLAKYQTLLEYENIIKNNSIFKEVETKYQTEKKEKENLELKQKNLESETKRKQNRNLLIGSILFIALGGTIATLTLQNSKRKRKLAEQQKELESQKNLTLIKEQEITTINAMVEGQEKERKRVAEDLHDNLGSVLATLKLHFENLRINREKKKINQEELFDKTENLIDEAYLKVRKIAHAKNAGVIANQGLLAAVQMMAEKISSAEKLQIEVVDFGLDKRLENTLEITVFRIIQELTTNIIKHAEATLATIQISLFDKTLNIIIEDNGKGFNPKKLQLKSGIGISSIKTRIEHLEGTFEIDSTIGKGSTFILNIPIA